MFLQSGQFDHTGFHGSTLLVSSVLLLPMRRAIENGDGKVSDAKQIAIRELDLMHEAIEKGDLKNALFHKKLANMAIDEMMLNNKMIDDLSRK